MKRLLRTILADIETLFSDTSVSQVETLDALLAIDDVVQSKIACLREDIKQGKRKQ